MPAIGSDLLVQGKAKYRIQQGKPTLIVSRMNLVCSGMVARMDFLRVIYISSPYRVQYPGVLTLKVGHHL
jgi:hypothetical protein